MKGNTLESLDTANQRQDRHKAAWGRAKAWMEGGVGLPILALHRPPIPDHSPSRNMREQAPAGKAATDTWIGYDPAVPGTDLTVIQVAHKRNVSARRARKLRKRGVRCWYIGRTHTGKARFAYWTIR